MITSPIHFLLFDKSSWKRTNTPLKALLDASLLKVLLWSTFKLSSSLTTVWLLTNSMIAWSTFNHAIIKFVKSVLQQLRPNFVGIFTGSQIVFCTTRLSQQIWSWLGMLSMPLGSCLFHNVCQMMRSCVSIFILPLRTSVFVVQAHSSTLGFSRLSSHENIQIFQLFSQLQILTARTRGYRSSIAF